ncbi:MAG: ABC transporter permease [Thaumarchaeota archaeon]|nr:ABC transporter permease [Nitrososphaerota archaeon]
MVSFKRIFADLSVFRREYLRNRTGFFFALVFPVILILIFGAIFSGGSNGPIAVYAQNHDSGPIGAQFIHAMNSTNVTRIFLLPNNQSLTQYLQSNSGDVGLYIPQNFSSSLRPGNHVNITIYSNPSDTSGQIVLGVANGVVNFLNLRLANSSAIVGLQSQNVVSKSYSYIDFLIPGLIGFSILTSPMFSMVNISSEYKKSKFFKQLSLTPLTKGEWLVSKVIWYVLLSIISFVLMTLFGTFAFHAHVGINAAVIPFLVVGPLFFVSLGMLVGTVTKSVESAGVIGNIITFPMMFLSGTFFPISLMPTYLQAFAHVLPLFYLIEGLNNVMVYSNYSQAVTDVLVLVVISAVVFVLAVRFFKWRED